MGSPFISIVMAVYNNEKLLPNAVNSILGQTFPDWELIIVDDGSTDNTPQVADAFAAADRRIRVIHQSNQWIFKSYNNGYAAAEGEYVLIVNSDDTINPDALKEIHDIAVIDQADMVMFNLAISACDAEQNVIAADMYQYGNLLEKPFSYRSRDEIHRAWPYFIERKLIHHQCVYRKNIYKAYAYQDRYFADDMLYNQRIAGSIHAAAGTPYLVYNAYIYGNETMNASVGKYYGYEHEMYNLAYSESRRLLEGWGVMDPKSLDILAAERLRHFSIEVLSYCTPQCPLKCEEKLRRVFESAGGLVYDCASESGRLEEWESRTLSGARTLLLKEPLEPGSPYYFVYELLDSLLRYEKDADDIRKIRAAVYHERNPKHIGGHFLRKLGLE